MNALSDTLLDMIFRHTGDYVVCCAYVCKTWRRICIEDAQCVYHRICGTAAEDDCLSVFTWAKDMYDWTSALSIVLYDNIHNSKLRMFQTLSKTQLMQYEYAVISSMCVCENTQALHHFLEIVKPNITITMYMKQICLVETCSESCLVEMLKILVTYEIASLQKNHEEFLGIQSV